MATDTFPQTPPVPLSNEQCYVLDPFQGEYYLVNRALLAKVRLVHMRAEFRLVRHADEFGRHYLSGSGRQSFAGNVRRVSSRIWEWDALTDSTSDSTEMYTYREDLQENAHSISRDAYVAMQVIG